MSVRETYGANVRSRAPLLTQGALRNFKTYSSAAFEPEAVMGASPLTPIADAIGNFLLVVGAVALVCSVAVSIPLAVFLMFFASFD